MKKTLFIMTLIISFSLGGNMFSLSGIKKVYPVVEISGDKIPSNTKSYILNELNTTLNELKIDFKGYNQRSIAFLISQKYVDDKISININLLIAEEVYRLKSKDKTFALTYKSDKSFFYSKDDVEENMEDSIDELLAKFSNQYIEDNKKIDKIVLKDDDLAKELGYETNYKEAMVKAKKEKKNVIFILVANYCPWCRKFEQRVLLKKEVNRAIHSKYIPLILNREKGEFPKRFYKSMTPIVHFIDYKTQKSYHRVVGYNNREDFLRLLEADK